MDPDALSPLLTIVGTAVAVASLMGAVGLFALRAVIAKDVKPLNDTMISLQGTVKALDDTLTATSTRTREDAAVHRTEWQETVNGLRDILAAHQQDISDHKTRITVLEKTPQPESRPRNRRT